MTQPRPLLAVLLARVRKVARRSPATVTLASGASCLAGALALAVEPDLAAIAVLTAVACSVGASARWLSTRASRHARLRIAGGILAAAAVVS